MSRSPDLNADSLSYVAPLDGNGATPDAGTDSGFASNEGVYTLASGTTYYLPLGGADAKMIGAHLQWDAEIVITSITVEDSNLREADASDHSAEAGAWIDEDPSTAHVGVVGSGVSASNGVVAATGGAQGGCMFHIGPSSARRTRLAVVVGGTGGALRCLRWAKE